MTTIARDKISELTLVMEVTLPAPVVRPRRRDRVDVDALERDLAAAVDGEVRFDAGSRGAYSTDASNYRQVPIGVVIPRTIDAGVDAPSRSAAATTCRCSPGAAARASRASAPTPRS